MDRTLGAGKPVDPATRLSELLAQSLEELTRPFDPPRPVPAPAKAASAPANPDTAASDEPKEEHEPTREESRMDADKALAELEAELFAAAKQVDSDAAIPAEEPAGARAEHPDDHHDEPPHDAADRPAAVLEAYSPGKEAPASEAAAPEIVVPPPLAPAEPPPDADAARVIAKVRRLMLVSMGVTVIAVGSVFGFIGYRIYKDKGVAEKKADKLPETSPIPNDVTLSLPRGARVVQSAVTADRLVMTLEIDGKIEVRTFDVKTLQPTGRLDFSATP